MELERRATNAKVRGSNPLGSTKYKYCMRLRELTGYRKNPAYASAQEVLGVEDYVKQLQQRGFEFESLGSGLYAHVLAKPGADYVVKIYKNDAGYDQYLQYIMQLRGNPHVPKLRGNIIKLPNNFRVVRMERLDSFDPRSTDNRNVFNMIDYILANDGRDRDQYQRVVADISRSYPEIMAVLEKLKQHGQYDLDFGISNLMFRGSVPVITDPLAIDD